MLKLKRMIPLLALVVSLPSLAVTLTARQNDHAHDYTLTANGVLTRRFGNLTCRVTTDVLDVKISQHPTDVAVVYYIKDENTPNLFALNNGARPQNGNCPPQDVSRIMSDVARVGGQWKYHVVSNTNTTIVNVAMSRGGRFVAWDRRVPVLTRNNAVNYTMHNRYHVAGAPFSRYVAFVINDNGHVLKVDGAAPASSNYDTSQRYDDLADFRTTNRIQ